MIELAIMIEGQNGLNWPRWKRMARAVEDLGFAGLYRSDHYTNASGPPKESLELWISLAWLAHNSAGLEFGPLVSPVSFREPTMTARMAAAVDDLSGGRLTLGLGAGWQEREHETFGHDLLDVGPRFDRFQEGLEVISRLLQSDQPSDFQGEYYRLKQAVLLPRPQREGGPPILIGGNGPRRTLPLVAQYASEWNGVFITPQKYADLNSRLDELLVARGRQPEDVKRSLMTGTVFARSDAELKELLEKQGADADTLREKGLIVGTGDDFVAQIKAYEEAGAYRLMLQWLELDDVERLEAMAQTVLPQVS